MTYYEYNVSLTDGQKNKLLKSYQAKAPFTLRLKNSQLSGSDTLRLTQTQINRIKKSINTGTGIDLRFSATQMRKQDGGSLFSSLLPILTKTVMPLARKAIGPLASGALSGLSSFGVNKILGGSGLFSVPQDKVDKLIAYKSYLTPKQKEQIVQALQSGSGMTIQLTKKQQGGFLGSLLASIGIPMLMSALTGKGLQVAPDRRSSNSGEVARVVGTYQLPPRPTKGGSSLNYTNPPFVGNWGEYQTLPRTMTRGYGVKKRKAKVTPQKDFGGKGLILGKNSPFNGIPILGTIL